MHNLRLVAAKMADLSELSELEELCFSYDVISKRSFAYHLKKSSSYLFLSKCEEKIVGYILAFYSKRGFARIYSLCSHPDYRNLGIADMMLAAFLEDAKGMKIKNIYLEVKKSSENVRRKYAKFGFVETKEIAGYYSDGSDAIKMLLKL